MMMLIIVLLITSLTAVYGACTGQATYAVTFQTVWTASSHPKDYPSSAHWSGLVGGSHNSKYQMWVAGGKSTLGMKNMAEFGGQSTLLSEMRAQGSNVLDTEALSSIYPGTGTRKGSLDVDGSHSLVSLVSMVAPSPDWFVGVHDLDLCNGTTWTQSMTVDLFPYDAGTDSGLKFASANSATSPQESIYRLTGTNPNNAQSSFYGYNPVPRMATLGFVRTSLTTPTQQLTTQQTKSQLTATTQQKLLTNTTQLTTVTTIERRTPNTTAATTVSTVTTQQTGTTIQTATTQTPETQTPETQTPETQTPSTASPPTTQLLPGKCFDSPPYSVLFKTSWTRSSYPKDFPASAHWSGLVGASHNADYTMWNPGNISSLGIERMAEFGLSLALEDEIKREQRDGNVLALISLDGIEFGVGYQSGNLRVDGNHSLVSVVSKISPSPDWFVGIHGVDLCDTKISQWKETVSLDLYPYDAGTDSGLKFISPNSNTDPAEPIYRLTGTMPNNNQSSFYGYKTLKPMATVTLTLGAQDPSGSNCLKAGIITVLMMWTLLLVI